MGMLITSLHRKEKIAWIALAVCLISTQVLTAFPSFIEHYYANGLYPYLGTFLRMAFGWIPFSLGDLLVALLIARAIIGMYRAGIRITRKQYHWKAALLGTRKMLFALLSGYVVFHCLWGFNYYRQGSAHILHIQPGEYSTPDVDSLLQVLNRKLTAMSKDSQMIHRQLLNNRKELVQDAMKAYNSGAKQYAFLQFSHASVKPNLIGPLQSYTGYGGYLFPFTGEAQVNFYAPSFTLPFTVCHEMAHQLGFGSESEANMIGFLAAKSSAKLAFVYSAYVDLHGYALNEMWKRDSVVAKQWMQQMPSMVRQHRMELVQWARQHENPIQPMLNYVYEKYLFSTNQPLGLQSYNRVVAWLIAYGKKYGWDKI